MTGREYLEKVSKINVELEILHDEITEVRALAEKCTSQLHAAPSHSSGRSILEDRIASLVELEDQLNARISEIAYTGEKAFLLINRLEDFTLRKILLRRYLKTEPWNDIARELKYSLQRVFELHDKAIVAFEKVWKESAEKSRVKQSKSE